MKIQFIRKKCFIILLVAAWILGCCVGCGKEKPVDNNMQNSQVESQHTQTESENTQTQGSESESTQSKDSESTESSQDTEKEETQAPPASEEQNLSKSKKLQVIGNQLCDSKGNPIILRGLSTHGLAWYPDYVNEAAFKEFHEKWGMNVIRLAMYTNEYGGYCAGGDQAWLKSLIQKGVDYATKNDMYVIIDWHILSDGNPHTYKSEAKEFFREMSALYANYDNVIYEICNEPNGGTSWAQIKSYAEEVIPVIRANDADALVIVGTPNWCQYVKDAAADPITKYDNIMYALHFYAATHTDWLRNDMVTALNSGLPIFVSEYGICDASGNGGIDEYQANEWIRILNQYGISHVGWNISNKNETSAIFGSWCNKTSGWTKEDLSESGKWMYEMLTK